MSQSTASKRPKGNSVLRRVAAWSVHFLTASGAVCGLFGIAAVANQEWRSALGWMALAVAVDGLDGLLARLVGVAEVIPEFDGALLDNLVDYITYVLLPAFYLARADLLPESWRLLCAAAICLASTYQFCQRDAKTADHFFRGFPSYWNIVVFYFHYLILPSWLSAVIIGALVLLVFVPIKWIYPSRMLRWQRFTMTVTLIWCAGVLAILWFNPAPSSPVIYLSLVYVAYYILASFVLARRLEDGLPAPLNSLEASLAGSKRT